ncbi:hypothetical protein BJY04DRAFT_16221 [Aspergillus karnatakaensis]|uniref:uncharacterized protein n=1 Tax=Aspergillus karnatakaensis TaxID=1810916 RepID=UPI003CCD113C
MRFSFLQNEDEDDVFFLDAMLPEPVLDYDSSSSPTDLDRGPVSSQKGITFLDLPEDIKIRILKYAGLIRPCLINIAYEQHRRKADGETCSNGNPVRMSRLGWTGTWISPYYGPTCDHSSLPVGALQASHAAHRELGALFYAHNHFTIDLCGKAEFDMFNYVTRSGLQHLRHLHLDLGTRNRYLKLSGGVHRTLLGVWMKFCADSRERMPALRNFSLKCKVKELEVASRLMCIMDPFPTLAHCAFHFNSTPDDDIRPVLRRAAWRLTGKLDERPPFPFAKLPKEIQLMILEYVLVGQSDPFLSSPVCGTRAIGFIDRRGGSTLYCCGTCSPLRAMCFCSARQTAFSTSCTCFSSPMPYFLVSREFSQDCRRLFFAKNQFTVVEEDPEPVMRFMTSIPTSSFMQIRHLSFKFPKSYRLYHRNARNEDAAILSWCVLRRFILEHFDLPRLSLRIVDLGTNGSIPIRNKYLRKMLKGFTDLQGLRDFQVCLADDRPFEKELELAVLGRPSIKKDSPEVMLSIEAAGNDSL